MHGLILDRGQILPNNFPDASVSASGTQAGYHMHDKIWGRVLQTLEIPDGFVDTNGTVGIGRNGQCYVPDADKGIAIVDRSRDPLLIFCINSLIPYLKSLNDSLVQIEKISTFINFIGTNPDFQDKTSEETPQLLGEVFKKQGAVCRHKSLMFKILCDELGIESAIRGGFVKQESQYIRHLWNEVCINGEWFVVDNSFQKDKKLFKYEDIQSTYCILEEDKFVFLESIGEGKKSS